MYALRVSLSVLLAFLAACAPASDRPATAERPDDDVADAGRLGVVHLPSSCGEAADVALERGLALLHHMTYEQADAAFAEAVSSAPGCALGYWGRAMTRIHPLWSDPPSAERFRQGAEAVAAARRLEGLTEAERLYMEAVGAYYDAGRGDVERPNLVAFADGWAAVHEARPDDPEAAAFHALSLLGTASASDKSYEVQRRAGAMAETVLAEHPRHPGAHHYVIHAYDYPPLADRAIEVARGYGEIAPSVAHALHMPTHIFTRLGLWEASIEFNARSADAAREHPVGDSVSLHFNHALDYLAYAHLQRAEWDEAQAILDTLRGIEAPMTVEIATPYTHAAVPARIALERGAWETAAALPVNVPAGYPWDAFPAMEAITRFARGIGAARSGDPEAARIEAERLAELRDRTSATSQYWATQVEIQRLAVEAWADFASGDRDGGLATMRESARLEGTTEKHPVTPGEILPARELLGQMLMEMERWEEAETAFAASLERSPRRLGALYGAGYSAEMAGDLDAAARWYGELLELTADGALDPAMAERASALAGA